MTEDELIKFLNRESIEKKEGIRCLKFIYTGNENAKLKEETLIKISRNNNYKHWRDCVENYVITPKNNYIDALLQNENPIKYIIFSEAPKLTWKSNKNPISNYLLRENKISGSYKSAPLAAFDSKEKNIIQTFVNKRVAFIDLIDLPLPINGELRRKWNYEINISGKPLSIFFLENAIKSFIRKADDILKDNKNNKNYKKLKFAPDINFAFMMPPLMSMGIIEYFNKEDISLNISQNKVNVCLAKELIVECNNVNTKTKKDDLQKELLPLYSRVAMSGSNTPSCNLLKHALNLI